MSDQMTEPVLIALTDQVNLREKYAHERECLALQGANNMHDKIHQRIMAYMAAREGVGSAESYCCCDDELKLYRASCRVLARFFGSHGVSNHDQ